MFVSMPQFRGGQTDRKRHRNNLPVCPPVSSRWRGRFAVARGEIPACQCSGCVHIHGKIQPEAKRCVRYDRMQRRRLNPAPAGIPLSWRTISPQSALESPNMWNARLPGTVTVAVDIRGGSPSVFATDNHHLSAGERILDALCFTGGSVHGLEAVTGMMSSLLRRAAIRQMPCLRRGGDEP